jgi:hypothetical protein
MTKTRAERIGEIAAEVRAEIARRLPKKPRTEFAAELGISPTAWDDRLSGAVEWRITELVTLAGILGVEVAEFLPATEYDRLGAR